MVDRRGLGHEHMFDPRSDIDARDTPTTASAPAAPTGLFHQAFCQDLPDELAAIMAVTQRPGALASLGIPSGPPAWKTVPSWYLVAQSDRVIPPDSERLMAKRAGATTVEVDSSHVAMISHPDEVTDLILAAVAG